MEIIWKDIPGYEGIYQVSNLGKVKSLDRIDYANRKLKGQYLAGSKDKFYSSVVLYKNAKSKTYRIHLLMAMAFLNHVPSRMYHVDHIDGDSFNNSLDNIRVVTARENSQNTNKKPRLGYSFYPSRNKYKSQAYYNNKSVFLGYFDTEQEARDAYNNFINHINKNK